jgi:hypothetical protein
MSKIVHLSLDVRGALRWSNAELGRMGFTDANGNDCNNGTEVREFLMDHLQKGHRVLPMAECDGFSFETGCPGHVEKEEAEE